MAKPVSSVLSFAVELVDLTAAQPIPAGTGEALVRVPAGTLRGLRVAVAALRASESEAMLAMCRGKERFGSPGVAKTAAERRPGRDYYRCSHCGGWHIGGTGGKKHRRQSDGR